jgi:hypothetical protein
MITDPHWGFIIAAYVVTGFACLGLIVRAILDQWAQVRTLAALDARGAGRQSK